MSPAFRVALVAPRMTSGERGGSERMRASLHRALLACGAAADLVEVPCDESSFDEVMRSYGRCYDLDLERYDAVISTKAPTFMVRHRNHVSLLEHTLRVFYDRFDAEFPDAADERRASRRQIQRLDLAAFSDGLVRGRFANGAAVAERLVRADPRWSALPFEVLHFPPRMRSPEPVAPGTHFVLPGRLHRWKRVELAIRAVQAMPGDSLLHVIGTGEDAARVRAAAGDDPRIRFHGTVSDAELDELYAGAIAVPFVPVDEDYGFVTVEAFAFGRPVVTCADSGEPARIARATGGGLVVAPEPAALAAALVRLRDDPDLAARMGAAGRKFAETLSWEDVARRLLDAAGFEGARAGVDEVESPLTLAVLDTQPIEPAVGGGRLRLRGLYGGLDEGSRAIYVGSYDWRGPGRRRVAHGPRLEERTVPHSEAHFAAAEELARLCNGRSVIDVSQPLLAPLSHELLDEARRAIDQADVIVFSHPWLHAPLADSVERHAGPVVYDAQNLEWRLRRELLAGTPVGEALAESVGVHEGALVRRADLILVCSEAERLAFAETYGVSEARIEVVPNGADTRATRPAEQGERAAARARFGLGAGETVALFIGSAYAPNVEAARFLGESLSAEFVSTKRPDLALLVVGAAGAGLASDAQNLHVAGEVDEAGRLAAYHAADIALNPVVVGAGTNVKMFEYMAAGLPILSTSEGARGIDPGAPAAFLVRPREGFAAALAELADDPAWRAELGSRARALVCARYDWDAISARVAGLARGLRDAGRAPAVAKRRPAVSVVVPSFDRRDRLTELLAHLDRQELGDFEVILVEQGLDLPPLEAPEGLQLRHVRTPVRGAVRARNTGLALATADLVAFVDDDCWPEPGWLEALVAAFDHRDVVGVEGSLLPDRPEADPATVRVVTNQGFEGIGFMTANLAARRHTALRIGGFDEIFDHPHFREDTDFGWRLCAEGEVPFVGEARVVHPVMPRGEARESSGARARFFEKDPVLFEKHPKRYPDLFVAEGHYKVGASFWEPFRAGLEKYDARIDAAALCSDPRVERGALPEWLLALADGRPLAGQS